MKPLKPLEVDEFTAAKSRVKTKMYLDRNTKEFFAKVGNLEIREPTAQGCKQATIKALGEFNPYVWTRLIDASVGEVGTHSYGGPGHFQHAQIDLRFRRYERAPKFGEPGFLSRTFEEDLSPTELRWQKDDGSDIARAKNEYVRNGEEGLPLPYSDELWAALVSIQETVEKARAHVEMLLDPKDRGQKLLTIGTNALLLTAGKKP